MNIYVELLVLVTDIVVIAYALWFCLEAAREGHVPPFIRTRLPVAEEVADAFGTLPEGSVLYDPGCGDGRSLAVIAKRNPQARFVGLELRYFPYFLGMRRLKREPVPNMTLVRANVFKTNLSEATHMYTYLYPKFMDELLPKLEKELKPGAKLVSLDFIFKAKEYVREIPLKSRDEKKLGRTLYIYEF